MAAETLDVRTLPSSAADEHILSAFDALLPGTSLVIVDNANPARILERLQQERPGAFEWNRLEHGPDRFRVEIQRRARCGPRSAEEFLESDHRRMDDMLWQVERDAHAGRFFDAISLFAEFRCGLEWHIKVEEAVLFPAFERMTDMPNGPTEVMRAEHVDIRARMDAVGRALQHEREPPVRAAIRALVQAIGEHNMKEEHILYPATDRVLGSVEERDVLVRTMQAFS